MTVIHKSEIVRSVKSVLYKNRKVWNKRMFRPKFRSGGGVWFGIILVVKKGNNKP